MSFRFGYKAAMECLQKGTIDASIGGAIASDEFKTGYAVGVFEHQLKEFNGDATKASISTASLIINSAKHLANKITIELEERGHSVGRYLSEFVNSNQVIN